MKRVALLGGSFNPPHISHQMICLWLLSTRRADQIWMMPCNEHPFHKALLPFAHRTAMCSLAAELFPKDHVIVTNIEAEFEGPSRTLNTIKALIERYPEIGFSLVIGADILGEKDSWYRFDEIERLVSLHVIGRTGYASPEASPVLPPISSSGIREGISRSEDVSTWLPASVLAYIQHHGLYQE